MMMKHIIKLLVLLFAYNESQAQFTERVQFHTGNFLVLKKEPVRDFFYPFIRQIGCSYHHQLNYKTALSISFNHWFQVDEIGGNPFGYNAYYEPFKQPKDRRLGDIDAHYDYSSIDINLSYILLYSKRHRLYGAPGISFTWGEYSEYTGIYNHPGYPDWLFRIEGKNHQDVGVSAEIGYNYLMARQRINLGISETVRTYTTLPFQFYTNINIGYNFNWGFLKKKTKTKP